MPEMWEKSQKTNVFLCQFAVKIYYLQLINGIPLA